MKKREHILPWRLKWKEKKANGSKEIFYSVGVKRSCISAKWKGVLSVFACGLACVIRRLLEKSVRVFIGVLGITFWAVMLMGI